MQFRRTVPAMGRIPAAEYGVTLGDFFFPVFLGERLGARLQGLALAIAGASTTPFVPGAPATRALGLPEVAMDTWYALFATGGTPAAILERLRSAAAEARKSEDLQSALKSQGLTALATSPQEFERQLSADFARWIPVVEDVCRNGCD